MEALKELAIQFFKSSMEKTQRTLSFVPADKLTWRPAPTARSALEIAAHVGVSLGSLAELFEKRGSKPASLEAFFEHLRVEEPKYSSLDSVQALLESSAARMVAALESIPADEIASGSIEAPFGVLPLTRFMFIPEGHTHEHAAQIDYLQTILGDMVPH